MTKQEAIQVVDLTKELLTPESKWTKSGEFGIPCHITQKSFTLGCALDLMQISVTGGTAKRDILKRKIRWKIVKHFFWRLGLHPIYHFNKNKKTDYADVIFLLDEVKKSLQ